MTDAPNTAAPAPAPAPAADTTLLGGDAPAPAPAAPAPSPAPASGTPSPSPAPSPAPSAAPSASPAPTPAPSPAPAAAGAPEKYEDFKLPETLKADEPLMGKFADWAKTHNLSQEAAQAAVDLAAEMQTGTAAQVQAHVTEFYKDIGGTPDTWKPQAKADKEFGGDKFDESMGAAATARDQFGTPELKRLLEKTELNNHPEVIRWFVRAGKAISQDGFVSGRANNGGRKTDADVIYGQQTH